MRWYVIVTGVANPAHLIHVASLLRRMLADDLCERLTVAVVGRAPTLGRIDITDESVRALLPDDPRVRLEHPTGLTRWRFPADEWAAYVAVGAPGLKPYARITAANPGRRIPIVVTDEGLGTYGDTGSLQAAWARQGVGQPHRTLRTVARETGRAVIPSQRWPLYQHVDRRWSVHAEVAQEFRRRVGPVAVDPDRVVMLTQPWTLFGAITPLTYRDHIRQIARALAREGRRLSVRPHPAEDRALYTGLTADGIAVLKGTGPAELDHEVLSAAEVVGGPSSAVLNLAALYGRPARVVAPPVPGVMARLTAEQRSLLDTYTTGLAPDHTATELSRAS